MGQLIDLSARMLLGPIAELGLSGYASFLQYLEYVPATHATGCGLVVVDELRPSDGKWNSAMGPLCAGLSGLGV